MGQALYRKYRTKTFAETIGQEHITVTLQNALRTGKLSHAYLLTGPRGTGKTSVARILAHEINGLPYDGSMHLDIIEIDAASNRRIDEIRDLRDRVSTAPASAKYKVYIIDEVHMLTKEAFNALLKTLEEPPAHVVFILATTEAHKLPDTIVSRTQRYSFRPVPLDKVVAHLRSIADAEKIVIDDDALGLIAEHGEGSFRDSISLLDQASSTSEHVHKADVEQTLGLAPETLVGAVLSALEQNDSQALVGSLGELHAQGFEPAIVAAQIGSSLRQAVVAGIAERTGTTLELLKQLLDVPAARSPRQLLEIILLRSLEHPETPRQATPRAQPQPAKTRQAEHGATPPVAIRSTPPSTSTPPPASKPQAEPPVQPVAEAAPDTVLDVEAASGQEPIEDIAALWQATLNEVKKQYNTLYGIARMAEPVLHGDTLTLTFKFSFHQKRINEPKNRKVFADIVERLHGKPVEIVCKVGDAPKAVVAKTPDVSAISNIFGGAELLES